MGRKWSIVQLQKRIGDKFYYVVEAVPVANLKKLRVVSAYINKNGTFLEETVPNGPSRYVQDEPQSNESFSNNSIPRSEENVTKKYSINVDSLGNKLTEAQQEYFENSKVRDEEGRLKPLKNDRAKMEYRST